MYVDYFTRAAKATAIVCMSQFSIEHLTKAKDGFDARGESVAAWARSRGFSRHLVYAVLSGKCHAKRGQGHLIAVALGLKGSTAGPSTQTRKDGCIE